MYRNYIKRILDIVLSFTAIILLSWLLLILAVGVKIESRGPVLFKQKRIGKNKRYFYIYKFRSMRVDTPKDMPTHMLTNPEQFITSTGRFMRKTSLDELPQLFNILKGDMSLVGPRPALWNQEDLIAGRDKYGVNDIRPGLTGWAQINGRDEIAIPLKVRLDGEYVKKESLLFDARIILGTVKSVLKHDGVKEGGVKESGIKEGRTKESGIKESEIKENRIKEGRVKESGIKEGRTKESGIKESGIKENRIKEGRIKKGGVKK